MEHFYRDIGRKIKHLAWGMFLTEAIASIITGIVLLGEYDEFWPICILLGGPIVAWVSSWLMYAFGEAIDKLCEIAQNTHTSAALAQLALNEEQAKRNAEAERIRQETERRLAEERAEREAEHRRNAEERAKQKQTQLPTSQVSGPTEKSLADKLQYALKYQTDEGMISYLQKIDDDAVRQILDAPTSSVRNLVRMLLETL